MGKKIYFKLNEFIDNDNKYHLWMAIISSALNDLVTVNQLLAKALLKESKTNSFFFFRIAVGYLKESYDMLNKFNGDNRNRTALIDGFEDMLKNINRKMNQKSPEGISVNESFFTDSRNELSHYLTKQKDFDKIKKVLEELYKVDTKHTITASNELLEMDYSFIEYIQLNLFADFYNVEGEEKIKNEISRVLREVAEFAGNFISIFELILINFLNERGIIELKS